MGHHYHPRIKPVNPRTETYLPTTRSLEICVFSTDDLLFSIISKLYGIFTLASLHPSWTQNVSGHFISFPRRAYLFRQAYHDWQGSGYYQGNCGYEQRRPGHGAVEHLIREKPVLVGQAETLDNAPGQILQGSGSRASRSANVFVTAIQSTNAHRNVWHVTFEYEIIVGAKKPKKKKISPYTLEKLYMRA